MTFMSLCKSLWMQEKLKKCITMSDQGAGTGCTHMMGTDGLPTMGRLRQFGEKRGWELGGSSLWASADLGQTWKIKS